MSSPGLLLTLFAFVAILGPLIFIHELGHYLVGRWFGVKAETFSIGFGKELTGWTDKRGTRWKLSALPLGGYVQFAGDMNPAGKPDPEWLALPAAEREKTFQAKPVWQRALIVLAGPAANFLLAILILAAFNFAYGKLVTPPVIGLVAEGSPAAAAQLEVGDRIAAVNGSEVGDFDELFRHVVQHPGERLALTIERDGDRIERVLTIGTAVDRDRFGNEFKRGKIGIGSAPPTQVPVGPVEAVTLAGKQTGDIVTMMVTGIGQIITGRRTVDELGGPIKIAKYSGEQLATGWRNFAWFAALISINLGFINLLPIPMLDGGHLAFYAAEAVRRRPASVRVQEWAFRTGLAFVLALTLFVTINDLASLKLFGG